MKRKRGWKKPILERAKAILNDVLFNVAIAGDDDAFLRELVALHPEADDKIGVGIDRFEVRPNDWNGRTFWLIRIDGTATDFSYIKSLSEPSPMQDFVKACRDAVVDDILEFKRQTFSSTAIICPVSGDSITWHTAHVDHAPPMTFDAIAREFAATRTDISADVEPTHDGDLRTYFHDPATGELFRDFHRQRAVLRAISREANLSLLKRSAPCST